MFKYIIIRLFWLVINIFVLLTLLFIVTRFAMLWYFNNQQIGDHVSTVINDYLLYMKHILTKWDWGESRQLGSVWNQLKAKAPITLRLNILAFIFYSTFGVVLGVVSYFRRNKLTDKIISTTTLTLSSIPSFILISLLVLLFSKYLNWLPMVYPKEDYTLGDELIASILPILALSAIPIANINRLMRAELYDVVHSDFLIFNQIKGLNRKQVILRHGLKHCFISLLPAFLSNFVMVITGSFFVEMIYKIPGIAGGIFNGLFEPYWFGTWNPNIDFFLILPFCLFYVALSLVFAIFIDIVYGFIDPRIRMGAKK